MQAFSKDNKGIKYLLTVIDVFSKFVWLVPLKRKTGKEVAHAFSRILKEEGRVKRGSTEVRHFITKMSKNYLSCTRRKTKKNIV